MILVMLTTFGLLSNVKLIVYKIIIQPEIIHFSYKTWASGAPDFCGLEKQTVLATDYWNSTLLKTGEHLDKQINVTTKIGNTYLTDDAGDAVVRTIDLHVKSENKVQGSTKPNQGN